MALKINKLQIENVKCIKAVKMEPKANGLTIIWQAVPMDMKLWQLIACAEAIYLLVGEMGGWNMKEEGKSHGRKKFQKSKRNLVKHIQEAEYIKSGYEISLFIAGWALANMETGEFYTNHKMRELFAIEKEPPGGSTMWGGVSCGK